MDKTPCMQYLADVGLKLAKGDLHRAGALSVEVVGRLAGGRVSAHPDPCRAHGGPMAEAMLVHPGRVAQCGHEPRR
eukprot:7131241-Alexandrium_andersonii.AAC.1